mmetsp:Transcript_4324/g.4887  ORF Transcript_4324/g.4887 Transcript_4324/m.4887 type:complete len:231 (+) Transcript_4324:646-1338(+)
MTTYLTRWMVRSTLREQLTFLLYVYIRFTSIQRILFPILEFVIHFQFPFGVTHQCLDGAIHFIIGSNRFPRIIPPKSGECHNLFLLTQFRLNYAIDFSNTYRHFQVFHLLGKLFPSRCKSLTPNTPRCVHVYEGHIVFCHPRFEVILIQFECVDSILLVHLFQGSIMFFLSNLALFSITAAKQSGATILGDLPFFNVFGNVLTICPERIPNVNRYIITMHIKHGDIKIKP